MSTDAGSRMVGCLTLGEYVAGLVEGLGAADPDALTRLRRVAAGRRARLMLDDEAVDVAFGPGGLVVAPPAADSPIDGVGATDRWTVLDLLDGRLEVTDAVRAGRLRVFGPAAEVVRMFMLIEILLDAAPRAPELQTMAAAFRTDPCRQSPGRLAPARAVEHGRSVAEDDLLRRLDLLADRTRA